MRSLFIMATLFGAASLTGMVVHAPSGDRIHGEFVARHGFRGFRDRGLGVRREILDTLLIERARAAGVCVLEDAKVEGVALDASGAACGVEVRTEGELLKVPGTVKASADDFGKEFLDMIIAAKLVDGVDEAIAHIRRYGSNHTESILTENDATAARFFQRLDSAILMRNASTQFADGGEFGMGGEIGIATGQDVFGLLWLGDQAHGNGGHTGLCFHMFGKRHLVAGTHFDLLLRRNAR